MSLRIETIASLIAIFLSIGTIFYHGVIIKRNVEILTLQSDKRDEKIQNLKNIIKINEKERLYPNFSRRKIQANI